MAKWCRRRESGAAVTDFVLLSGLVSLIFAAVLQVGYSLHIRNTATAHAIEGARVAARADTSPIEGAIRTESLLRSTAPGRYGIEVTSDETVINGVVVSRVTVDLPLPVLGPLGFPGTMTVTGLAYAEDQG
ncbi:pilus assembly protein [Ornithinimicrobium sp. Arc0846-15]|nr:pilus assembly protein [Ornithinimicrobium laminariae]